MNKLVFATNNQNKLKEVRRLLSDADVEILSLTEINCHDEIEEPFHTLEENARAKSDHVNKKYNMNCFADDTGLEIQALEGKPGVFSARYAGSDADSSKNIEKVLSELYGKNNRLARFRTVISLIIDGEEFQFEGIVNGQISESLKGEDGFGYDPIFVPDGFDKTFAEMSMESKNQISHRAIAVNKLTEFLKKYYV